METAFVIPTEVGIHTMTERGERSEFTPTTMSWEWGVFSEEDFDKLPDSTIPSLKADRAIFSQWIDAIRRSHSSIRADSWHFAGDRGYQDEFESLFGESLLRHCSSRLQEKQNLKIVSFGGGDMKGVLELRELLKQQVPMADISIVEFALTKEPAIHAFEDSLATVADYRSGKLRAHGGFLEIREIEDAHDADVMVSVNGPFFHQGSGDIVDDLVMKVSRRLAPSGRAFLHSMEAGVPGENEKRHVERIQNGLGDDFIVSSGRNEQFNGFFDIQRRALK